MIKTKFKEHIFVIQGSLDVSKKHEVFFVKHGHIKVREFRFEYGIGTKKNYFVKWYFIRYDQAIRHTQTELRINRFSFLSSLFSLSFLPWSHNPKSTLGNRRFCFAVGSASVSLLSSSLRLKLLCLSLCWYARRSEAWPLLQICWFCSWKCGEAWILAGISFSRSGVMAWGPDLCVDCEALSLLRHPSSFSLGVWAARGPVPVWRFEVLVWGSVSSTVPLVSRLVLLGPSVAPRWSVWWKHHLQQSSTSASPASRHMGLRICGFVILGLPFCGGECGSGLLQEPDPRHASDCSFVEWCRLCPFV